MSLPHQHGNTRHAECIQKELEKSERFQTAAELFKQLSDPTRVRIFWILSHCEECVINISAMLGMSSPAISHHLRALRDCGLIISRREGKEVYYRVADTLQGRTMHQMVDQIMELSCPEFAMDNSASQTEIIHHVHQYLLDHVGERITIEELSKQFLMNKTTLKQTFKAVYGTSIAAHMKIHRLEKAASLLRQSEDSIAQIAQAVGYESQSRFTAAFKESFGLLPTEYRKTYSMRHPSAVKASPKDNAE